MNNSNDIHQRAVTALQDHGFLFQKRCVEEIARLSGRYKLDSEEYPVSLGDVETVIDFVLRMLDTGRTYLAFECKRAHPDYVSWVFPASQARCASPPHLLLTAIFSNHTARTHESPIMGSDPLPVVEMGLEVSCKPKGAKSGKTDAIYAACKQAMTGIGGLVRERQRRLDSGPTPMFFYLPVVLTSADLFVICDEIQAFRRGPENRNDRAAKSRHPSRQLAYLRFSCSRAVASHIAARIRYDYVGA
jgi:hypothetical protein